MREILALSACGAIGAVARYAVSGWAHRLFGARFAYGTLLVNLIGCLLLGLLMELSLTTDIVPRAWRTPLAVGGLGAFTTFSTFGYETLRYLEQGAWRPALANIAISVVLGLIAVWIGFVIARAIAGGTA